MLPKDVAVLPALYIRLNSSEINAEPNARGCDNINLGYRASEYPT